MVEVIEILLRLPGFYRFQRQEKWKSHFLSNFFKLVPLNQNIAIIDG